MPTGSAMAETQQAVEATGRRAIAVGTDVSRPDDCQALVDATVAEFGKGERPSRTDAAVSPL